MPAEDQTASVNYETFKIFTGLLQKMGNDKDFGDALSHMENTTLTKKQIEEMKIYCKAHIYSFLDHGKYRIKYRIDINNDTEIDINDTIENHIRENETVLLDNLDETVVDQYLNFYLRASHVDPTKLPFDLTNRTRKRARENYIEEKKKVVKKGIYVIMQNTLKIIDKIDKIDRDTSSISEQEETSSISEQEETSSISDEQKGALKDITNTYFDDQRTATNERNVRQRTIEAGTRGGSKKRTKRKRNNKKSKKRKRNNKKSKKRKRKRKTLRRRQRS